MSKFSRYFLGVLFQIMSFLTHRAMYLSLTLVTSYHNYCDIFSSSFQKYNLHSYLCRTVLQMSLHSPLNVESNTFSFLSLSWPVLLYLSPQFPSCLRVTAASYVLVSPKSAVIATEKSHLTLALAVSSAQHCPSLCHQYLCDCTANWTRKMSWVTKMTLPSLLRGSLTPLCAVGGI